MTDYRNVITNDKYRKVSFGGHARNELQPLGAFSANVAGSTGVYTYTPPTGAVACRLAAGSTVRIKLDGNDPTATDGFPLAGLPMGLVVNITTDTGVVKAYQPAGSTLAIQWLGSQ